MKNISKGGLKRWILINLVAGFLLRLWTSLFLSMDIEEWIAYKFWEERSMVLMSCVLAPYLITSIVGLIVVQRIIGSHWRQFNRWTRKLFVIWCLYNVCFPLAVSTMSVSLELAIVYGVIYLLASWTIMLVIFPEKKAELPLGASSSRGPL